MTPDKLAEALRQIIYQAERGTLGKCEQIARNTLHDLLAAHEQAKAEPTCIYPACQHNGCTQECKAQPVADERQACGHPVSLLVKSAETGEPLYCEACDDKSGRRDAEQRETELAEANRALSAQLEEARAALAQQAAGGEAVAEVRESAPIDATGRTIKAAFLLDTTLPAGTKLYTHPAPAVPALPDEWRIAVEMANAAPKTGMQPISSKTILAVDAMLSAAPKPVAPAATGDINGRHDEIRPALHGRGAVGCYTPGALADLLWASPDVMGLNAELGLTMDQLVRLAQTVLTAFSAPAAAQRTLTERITDAARTRAMDHPVVLEIMADCVSCADTENDAMSDPEFAVHDSAPYRLVEADLRCQAAAIRAQDPEIWPSLEFAAPQQEKPDA